MSVISQEVQTYETLASAMRLGLIHVRPIEEKQIIKRWGIRFVQTRWSIVPEEVQSTDEYIQFTTRAALDNILIPQQFDKEKVADYLIRSRKERLEADTELKKAMEKLDKMAQKQRTSLIDGLCDFVVFLKDRCDGRYSQQSIENARILMMSEDLPLSIFADIALSDATTLSYLEVILKTIRFYRSMAKLPRARNEFRLFKRHFDEMKVKIAPTIDAFDDVVFREYCLKMYILLWNAPTYEEIFSPKRISGKNLDKNELSRLHQEFTADLRVAREHILHSQYFSPTPIIPLDDPLRKTMNSIVMSFAMS